MAGGRHKPGSASTSFRVDPNSPITGGWMILRACQEGSSPMSQATLHRRHSHEQTDHSVADMIQIPGSTFRMGSDQHYPEEAPVHRVTVDAFRIDRTPVTNRQFRD